MRVMAQLDLILEEEKKGAGRRGLRAKREAKVEAKRKRWRKSCKTRLYV
jgi:hypothetical protein